VAEPGGKAFLAGFDDVLMRMCLLMSAAEFAWTPPEFPSPETAEKPSPGTGTKK
jgi:hypothetical protein